MLWEQKTRHQRGNVLAPEGHRHRDPQQALRRFGQIAHAGKTAFDLRKGAAGRIHQRLAGFGKTVPLRVVRRTSGTPAAASSSLMRWLMAALSRGP